MEMTADQFETELLKLLPEATYTIQRKETPRGQMLCVTPAHPRAAEITLWSDDGYPMDIIFGDCFQIELDRGCPDDLLQLAEAVIAGQMVDYIWTFLWDRLYSKSVIKDRWTMRNGLPLPYPFWLKSTHHYEPYAAVTPDR
ncbi:hypothetical protein SAMN05421770_104128 [Granulicella rosea]|uniref:Uncharacterized protein n=1 Tax=Granulicella rosea TaxID=474952 RepID=A0A239JTU1_9BACT|nr:hypothetical protein [Granulicella rosea]SNT09281.1 hypothetical protein SAMN05421770_104128 [Granulicella rosea]